MDFTKESDIKAKIKRLRLEESRIIGVKNLHSNSNYLKIQDETEIGIFSYQQCSEYNKLREYLKENFNQIALLHKDIQNNTKKKEYLEELDIDDLKKDVFDLVQKFKKLKIFIKSELSSKLNEQHNIEQSLLKTNVENKIECYQQKPRLKLFNEIVPSPVRAIILSPLKSKEVQQYQNFLHNSPNRYGGWNEYNHNIFVQCWNKNFDNNNFELQIDQIEDFLNDLVNSNEFKQFMNEVLQKITGASVDNIICHCKWYAKYLFFYNEKQKALETWKKHKSKINKKLYNNRTNKENDVKKYSKNKIYYDNAEKVIDSQDIFCEEKEGSMSNGNNSHTHKRYKETREEFLNRLSKPVHIYQNLKENSISQSLSLNFDLDDIPKLCTPSWRFNL